MDSGEKREFLSEQLISYLGNKRSLLARVKRAARRNFKKFHA